MNVSGTTSCDCQHPWVYKERRDGLIETDFFVYVYDGQPVGTTETLCWEASRRWEST